MNLNFTEEFIYYPFQSSDTTVPRNWDGGSSQGWKIYGTGTVVGGSRLTTGTGFITRPRRDVEMVAHARPVTPRLGDQPRSFSPRRVGEDHGGLISQRPSSGELGGAADGGPVWPLWLKAAGQTNESQMPN